jgi:hypothetical protein
VPVENVVDQPLVIVGFVFTWTETDPDCNVRVVAMKGVVD